MSKISWGGMPPDPPRGAWIFIRFLALPLYNPPKTKMSRSALVALTLAFLAFLAPSPIAFLAPSPSLPNP